MKQQSAVTISAPLFLLVPRIKQQQQTRGNCPEVRPALAGRIGRRLADTACASKYLYLRGVITTSRGLTGAGRRDPGRGTAMPRDGVTQP